MRFKPFCLLQQNKIEDFFFNVHVTWEMINVKNILPLFGEYEIRMHLTTTNYKILLGIFQYLCISSSGRRFLFVFGFAFAFLICFCLF